MKQKIKNSRDWYVAYCDPVRGMEPRITEGMPAIRQNNGGKEVCVFTNYSMEDAKDIVECMSVYDEILLQIQKEIAWLKHIKPQVQAPFSVMMGFDQAIKTLEETLKKARGKK